jgi:uncharacterized protein YukE
MARVQIDGIYVETMVLRDTAARMRQFNVLLHDALTAAQTKIYDIQNRIWNSRASAILVDKIRQLQPTIERKKEVLEQYIRFLEDTAQRYDLTESARVADVGNLPTGAAGAGE